MTDARTQVTEIIVGLGQAGEGERLSPESLFPLVYEELRRLASTYMSSEVPGHTLQPTALVHEAYLKLVDQTRASFKGRTHFFAVGAHIMRRLLIDHARERGAAKRGAGWQQVSLCDVLGPSATVADPPQRPPPFPNGRQMAAAKRSCNHLLTEQYGRRHRETSCTVSKLPMGKGPTRRSRNQRGQRVGVGLRRVEQLRSWRLRY
jgi:DNA-directed RNA polymerase specialized sigma24 family protein